ncbi:ATP-binding protein [Falsirhodobacter sp. 20TX0035]|uniref:ATP-binding protein n=1 Tax=Falsirhodobacter sp. 20TX0035 TaxID=3022019 RepID=UPI0023309D50|nr:ATP-binding protein [Falsirhodobacter sp. 20TX0035]MDB6454757.1 ATP-binding protein [Falsirhodobacter sp. 20TX0035]
MQLFSATIPPDLAEVDAIAPQLTAQAQAVLPEDRLPAFEIAVVEALTNVIRHGGLAPGQTVSIALHRTPAGIEAAITDEGPALPPDLFAPRPEEEEPDPFAESGRGIGLILMCTDGVTATREGGRNRLVLRFDG